MSLLRNLREALGGRAEEARSLVDATDRLSHVVDTLNSGFHRNSELSSSQLEALKSELAEVASRIPDESRIEGIEQRLANAESDRLPRWLHFLALAAPVLALFLVFAQIRYQKNALDQQVQEMLIVRRFDLLQSIYDCTLAGEDGVIPPLTPPWIVPPCHPLANPRSRSEAVKSFASMQRMAGVTPILIKADLSGLNLRGANLRSADLRGSDWTDADIRRADLRQTNLRGSLWTRAALRCTDLRDADLRASRGLDQETLDKAILDSTTELPPALEAKIEDGSWKPRYWLEDGVETHEDCVPLDDPSGRGVESPYWLED